MAKEQKKIWIIAVLSLFVLYFFLAARPIKRETVLVPRWLSSLESGLPVSVDGTQNTETGTMAALPFTLGNRFGYVDSAGRFSVNQVKKSDICLSEKFWSEYDAEPESLEIKTPSGETALKIEDPRGYPLLLDGRIFVAGSEQNALSELDAQGNTLWTYEFAAPLTCIDAASGLVLTGSLDGVVEVLDRGGNRVFFFEPGGSRYAIVMGCAFSRDGSRIGVVCGVDDQRFLLLERFGGADGEYKVIYHEFLEDGFRRPVYISFIDEDRSLVFEREGGVGIYNINTRQGAKIAFNGELAAIERSGSQGLFFIITSQSGARKKLTGIRLPDAVILEAPFKSEGAFLGRAGSRLFVGGGTTLACFELEKK